jgi:hypothetical protein
MQAHEPSGQKGGTTTSCNGRRTPSSQTQRDAGRRLRIHQPRASKSLPIMPIMHLILILSRLPRTKVFCRQHADAAISLQASCRRSTLTGSSFFFVDQASSGIVFARRVTRARGPGSSRRRRRCRFSSRGATSRRGSSHPRASAPPRSSRQRRWSWRRPRSPCRRRASP